MEPAKIFLQTMSTIFRSDNFKMKYNDSEASIRTGIISCLKQTARIKASERQKLSSSSAKMILKSFTIRQNRWRPFQKNTLIKTRPWRKKCKHSKKINSRLRKRKIKFKLNSITRLKSSSTSCSMEVQLTVMMILGEVTTKP